MSTPADAAVVAEGENATTTAGSIGKPDGKPAEKTGTHRQPVPKLYRAYQLKEELRIILKMPYPDAVVNLDRWLWRASHLRIEATNNKIKLLIRTAYGFRNMKNMLSLKMLSCSYVEVKFAYKWEAECQKSSNKAA